MKLLIFLLLTVLVACMSWSGCSKSPMVHITSKKELRTFMAWDKMKYAKYVKKQEASSAAAYVINPNIDAEITWASVPRSEYKKMKQWELQHKQF